VQSLKANLLKQTMGTLDTVLIQYELLPPADVSLLVQDCGRQGEPLERYLVARGCLEPTALPVLRTLQMGAVSMDSEQVRQIFRFESLLQRVDMLRRGTAAPAPPVSLPDPAPPMLAMPEVGDMLGKCEIVAVLGHGATATVYQAFHKFLRIPVALKVLSPRLLLQNPDMESMFLDEAMNTARLNHPSLVRVFDAEKTPQYTYMVMEYIDGPTLTRLIEPCGKLPMEHAIQAAIEICSVLEYALEFNMIHRDIKPDNLMLTRKSELKLADFGLARVMHSPDQYQRTSGGLWGTPYYMSPEQFGDVNQLDHRSDMYSLGATLYYLSTGSLPLPGDSVLEVMMGHLNRTPEAPHVLNPELSLAFSDLILRLLAKHPQHRYPDYSHLIADLQRLQVSRN
jgi:tRNA A-37 threonylcarbamoyl transferase component Bud32